MSFFTKITPAVCRLFHGIRAHPATLSTGQRSFSALAGVQCNRRDLVSPQAPSIQHQQCRRYKVRQKLKLRCPGCYHEFRHGRLYVECDRKPRHKQMMQVNGMNLFRDDYSKGNWKKAAFWGLKEKTMFYKYNDKFSKSNWLNGRLGKEV